MATYIMAHPRPSRRSPCGVALRPPPWSLLQSPVCISAPRMGRSRQTCIFMESECCRRAHRAFQFFIDPTKYRLPYIPVSGPGGEP
jgi:hypothetical protein